MFKDYGKITEVRDTFIYEQQGCDDLKAKR